jgi:anti-sigma factor ChrR (cupin superfamily)
MTRNPAVTDDDWTEPTAEERAAADIAMAAPPVDPPEGLWAKIDRRLAAAQPIVASGIDLERFAEGPWRRTAPGVRTKRLWGRHMFLLDCEPGAVVPEHEHKMFEHTLILSGDVQTAEGAFGPGDYFAMAAGTRHAQWGTKGGCRVLIQYDA